MINSVTPSALDEARFPRTIEFPIPQLKSPLSCPYLQQSIIVAIRTDMDTYFRAHTYLQRAGGVTPQNIIESSLIPKLIVILTECAVPLNSVPTGTTSSPWPVGGISLYHIIFKLKDLLK